MLSDADIAAIELTLKLATTVTLLLLIVATPLAYWLAQTNSKLKAPIGALISLPLVLPPTVLGFYLLLAMGPNGPIGQLTTSIGIGSLAFSFSGLVIASMFYSLPFVVQPIQNAIEAIGKRPMEVAATLGASPLDCLLTVVLPLAKPGFISAAVLGFAHTVGEFGVVLMIGGNISGETSVISVQMYEHVESLEYFHAHILAGGMIVFSFLVLLTLYSLQGNSNLFGRSAVSKVNE